MPAALNPIKITVTHGPGLRVPFAAVIGDFDLPPGLAACGDATLPLLARWLPPECLSRLQAPEQAGDLPRWIERLALAITDMNGRLGCPSACGTTQTRGWVALGYLDPLAAQHALRCAHAALCATYTGTDDAAMKSQATEAIYFQRRRQAGNTTRAQVRACRLRNIPVYPVAPELQIWQYGQGRKGWQLHYSSTQADSVPGFLMQQNKAVSNNLVRRLGLPGTEHAVATRPQQAVALADRMGYPLVIKPADSGQGYGVTVGVRDAGEVAAAFSRAARYSPRRNVIVERYVAGDDYRLVVTGGSFQWATRRNPPEVTGDGRSSIAALIARKNAALSADMVDAGFAKPVTADDELRRTLAAQQRHVDDCPPVGTVVRLRSNANVSTGGSFTDVTAVVHPDNRAMAETIARAFRLDNMGMDFITPDITRSWREVACAVIEVNATPMLFCDAHARQLIDYKFTNGDDGRIPSLLVLCAKPAELYAQLDKRAQGIGIATSASVTLNGIERRWLERADTRRAIDALLLDPACESLIAICSPAELHRHGLPLDRFHAAAWLTDAAPDPALLEVLERACGKTLPVSVDAIFDTLRALP